jgi:predicted RNA-binding Zn ribbon-like protein
MTKSPPTGQLITSSDGVTWFFDSGSTALDFAYTGGFDHPQEPLRTQENLAAWLGERFPEIGGTVSDHDLADADALRHAIAHLAIAASRNTPGSPEAIDVINLFAATPDIPPALIGGHRQAGRSSARVGQAFSAMAREAVDLFAADQKERIRECAAADCRLVFYDESRPNNRRWCSMQRCGNRAKVRAHRTRALEQ